MNMQQAAELRLQVNILYEDTEILVCASFVTANLLVLLASCDIWHLVGQDMTSAVAIRIIALTSALLVILSCFGLRCRKAQHQYIDQQIATILAQSPDSVEPKVMHSFDHNDAMFSDGTQVGQKCNWTKWWSLALFLGLVAACTAVYIIICVS